MRNCSSYILRPAIQSKNEQNECAHSLLNFLKRHKSLTMSSALFLTHDATQSALKRKFSPDSDIFEECIKKARLDPAPVEEDTSMEKYCERNKDVGLNIVLGVETEWKTVQETLKVRITSSPIVVLFWRI